MKDTLIAILKKTRKYQSQIKTSLSWFFIRFFLKVPSKHFRIWYLNLHKGVKIDKSVALYGGR